MNTIVKSAIAGALALGGTTAAQAAIGIPSTNSSDVILYVDAISAGSSVGVYALDTGISLSSLLPGTYVSGAANSTKFSAPNVTIAASSGLSTFLSSHSAATIQWTIEGGQYTGTTSGISISQSQTPGAALAAFSSKGLTAALPNPSSAVQSTLNEFLTGLNTDLTTSAGGGIGGAIGSTNGVSGFETVGATTKYGFVNGSDLANTGSTKVDFFGLTANGNSGTIQSYLLGSATFDALGTLTINGNTTSAVPLPAAVWLFGSGLMGLVGVSRRRKAAV